MDNETNQTWRVRLWLSNDEGFYRIARSIADRRYDSFHSPEDSMRGIVEEMLGVDGMHGLLLDLITYDLDCVDWESIVEDFKEDD
jgi:hypothetical protein